MPLPLIQKKQRDKGIGRLWVAMAILKAVMLGGFACLRSDIQELESRMDKRFDKLGNLYYKKDSCSSIIKDNANILEQL